MTQAEAVQKLRESSLRNLAAARDLVATKHYDWALFVGQLALEKLLKGLVAKSSGTNPPLIHDLVKLAQLAKISLNDEQQKDLVTISRFHVQARYDDLKYELYKLADETYTNEWFAKIEGYYQWLETHF